MEPVLLVTEPAQYVLNQQHRTGNVVKRARKYVFAFYNEHLSGDHYYHTYMRVLDVVRFCKEISRAVALTDPEQEVLRLSAWFVDSGYVVSNDEITTTGIDIARAFLEDHGYPTGKTKEVISCIRSVQSSIPIQNRLAQILHDTYWLYLAQDDYSEQVDLLRAEMERLTGSQFSDEDWESRCLDDFAQHPFYTEYAQRKYNKYRVKNLLLVDHRLRKLNHSADLNHAHTIKNDSPLAFREIEDAFKLSSRNYVNLVSVADRKAGLLIHISSIMISIVLAVLLRHLVNNPTLRIPTILLLLVCSVTITFAILASRPTSSITESVVQGDRPILFFGSFDKTDLAFERVSWETYFQQFKSSDKDALFTQMLGEIYQTRQVLSRKFRHLTYAYMTFLIGMVVTVLAYIIAVLIQNPIA